MDIESAVAQFIQNLRDDPREVELLALTATWHVRFAQTDPSLLLSTRQKIVLMQFYEARIPYTETCLASGITPLRMADRGFSRKVWEDHLLESTELTIDETDPGAKLALGLNHRWRGQCGFEKADAGCVPSTGI